MDIYFLPMACSLATRIAFHEIGEDANFVEVDIATKRLLSSGDDYRAIHPLGLVPVLRTDDGAQISENLAVLRYVAQRGDLWPAEQEIGLLQWLSFTATELHAGLFAPQFDAKASDEVKAYARRRAKPRLDYLQGHLEGRDYLLDTFTVADAFLVTILNFSRGCALDLSPWPDVLRYYQQLAKRPSVAAAMEVELPLYLAEQARKPNVGAA